MEGDIGTMRIDGELKQRLDLRVTMEAISIADTGAVAAGVNDSE